MFFETVQKKIFHRSQSELFKKNWFSLIFQSLHKSLNKTLINEEKSDFLKLQRIITVHFLLLHRLKNTNYEFWIFDAVDSKTSNIRLGRVIWSIKVPFFSWFLFHEDSNCAGMATAPLLLIKESNDCFSINVIASYYLQQLFFSNRLTRTFGLPGLQV